MGGPPPALLPPASAEGQTYCLRWNNHKSNLVEILDALIKVESYVDCTIVVDDQVQFKAHRVVLAANSPYFQSILQNVPMDHCSIIFPGVKAFEMRALLEYMYTGEVNVTQSQIPKIMRIAEELEVKGLFDMADLKEKFNKLGDEHAERAGNPYASSTGPPGAYASAATSSTTPPNGSKPELADGLHSSSVISTSSNVSPSAAPSSSSSPPYSSYKSPYASLYSKSPGPSAPPASTANAALTSSSTLTSTSAAATAQTPSQPAAGADRAQWPISPGMPSAAAAAAMLSSVYESAPDMNPLKRKKLSSISSMLMNRDTPILRNVLAQTNPADSSQPMPLMLPATGKGADKGPADKAAGAAAGHSNNHSFNGSDYSSEKKYQEEPHSPYTDRSFEDDGFEPKGSNFGGNFGSGNAGGQKPEWKRYKQYTRNDIMSAIQCVRDGMSALQASRKFGVPSRTLYDKVKKLGITTGRPMNRTMKRSPSSVESSAAFPYAHGYGQSEPLLSSLHEGREAREERELQPKEHLRTEHPHPHSHHMPPTIPHHAAALLDHAFLQQALENRGGDIAGREALHAMALAAAAHAAVNRMSTSPGPNGTARSPSPSFALKYARGEHELMLEREKERRMLDRERDLDRERERECDRDRDHSERERERDADDEDDHDHVEDLSVARKDCLSPEARRADSPFPSPPPPAPPSSSEGGVIVPPMGSKAAPAPASSSSDDFLMINESAVKREIITDDGRAD